MCDSHDRHNHASPADPERRSFLKGSVVAGAAVAAAGLAANTAQAAVGDYAPPDNQPSRRRI